MGWSARQMDICWLLPMAYMYCSSFELHVTVHGRATQPNRTASALSSEASLQGTRSTLIWAIVTHCSCCTPVSWQLCNGNLVSSRAQMKPVHASPRSLVRPGCRTSSREVSAPLSCMTALQPVGMTELQVCCCLWQGSVIATRPACRHTKMLLFASLKPTAVP